jgi:hypothetical protein
MIGGILASIIRVVKSRRLQWPGCAAGRGRWVQNFDGEVPWVTWKDWKEMWDNVLRHVLDMTFEMFMDWSSGLWVLLFLVNGYCLRGTSHLHDQIVAYCENRKGVLKTLSFNCKWWLTRCNYFGLFLIRSLAQLIRNK